MEMREDDFMGEQRGTFKDSGPVRISLVRVISVLSGLTILPQSSQDKAASSGLRECQARRKSSRIAGDRDDKLGGRQKIQKSKSDTAI